MVSFCVSSSGQSHPINQLQHRIKKKNSKPFHYNMTAEVVPEYEDWSSKEQVQDEVNFNVQHQPTNM
jgi:hypothetical protein